MTTILESRASGSSTPSSSLSSTFSDSSSQQDLVITKAVTDSLNPIKAAKSRDFFRKVKQTTILRCGEGIVSDQIEIAVTAAQKAQEPVVEVSHLSQDKPRVTVATEGMIPTDQIRDADKINEALEKAPKRVVPKRGMSSDYGIGF